jgi:Ham1 family
LTKGSRFKRADASPPTTLHAPPDATKLIYAEYFINACVSIAHAEDPAPCIGQGIWRGQILTAARGSAGFGDDPIFIREGQRLSAAELAPNIKNQLSHRGLALAALTIDPNSKSNSYLRWLVPVS